MPILTKSTLLKAVLLGALLLLKTEEGWGQSSPAVNATAAGNPARAAAVSLSSYGARGDGLTDDTRAIQHALNDAASTGGRVYGDARATYLITSAGRIGVQVPSGGIPQQNYCLLLPSGVMLDLQGGTLKLNPASAAAYLAINAHPTAQGGDHDCGISNAVLDGSNVTATGTSMLTFAHTVRPVLRSVKIENGVYQGVFCFDCSFGIFDDLSGESFRGQVFAFGTPVGANNLVYDSAFGNIRAHNIASLNTVSQPGNGFLGVLKRCTIQSLSATDCAAGIKLQGPGSDVTVGSVFADTCGDASGNSGLKLQGDAATGQSPQRIYVNQVVCNNQTGTGLYLERDVDCAVGSYTGFHNNTLGTGPDVWVGGMRDQIGSVNSLFAGSDALLVRSSASGYRIDAIHARDPGQALSARSRAGASVQGGNGTMGTVLAEDDQAAPTMSHGFQNNERTAILSVDALKVSRAAARPASLQA